MNLEFHLYDERDVKFIAKLDISLADCPQDCVSEQMIEALRAGVYLAWYFKAFSQQELTTPTSVLDKKAGEPNLTGNQLYILLHVHNDTKVYVAIEEWFVRHNPIWLKMHDEGKCRKSMEELLRQKGKTTGT